MTDRAKTAVICGGTAGVGRATALALAQAGFRVAVIARGEEGLADTRAELNAAGAVVLAISADAADAEAVDKAADRIEAELGPISRTTCPAGSGTAPSRGALCQPGERQGAGPQLRYGRQAGRGQFGVNDSA
ncbi:MAG: SDR family NAD(P)-dependent oxidoreductase [Pseudomonas profundi]